MSKKRNKNATPPSADEEGRVNYNLYDSDTSTFEGKKGWKVKSRPPIMRPKLWEIGKSITGVVKEVVASYKKEFNSKILILELSAGNLVGIPIVGSIKPDVLDEEGECVCIGEEISILKTDGIGVSDKFKDDAGKPRKFPIFQVAFRE